MSFNFATAKALFIYEISINVFENCRNSE